MVQGTTGTVNRSPLSLPVHPRVRRALSNRPGEVGTHGHQEAVTLCSGRSGSAATQAGSYSCTIPFLQPRFRASDTSESRIDKVLRLSIVSQEVRYPQPLCSQRLTGFHPPGIPFFCRLQYQSSWVSILKRGSEAVVRNYAALNEPEVCHKLTDPESPRESSKAAYSSPTLVRHPRTRMLFG